jgi:glycosyltransferase involved in cell wall biosynthesis
MTVPLASVIIPTYNKLPRLKLTLNSFNYQSISSFELILIDDGSSDGTKQFAENFYSKSNFKYIYHENMGRAKARNIGANIAKSQILIFCDDDTIASNNFIENHIKEHSFHDNLLVHGITFSLPFLKFFHDPTRGILYSAFQKGNNNLEILKKYLISEKDIVDFEKIYRQKKIPLLEKQIQYIFTANIDELKWLALNGGNFSLTKEKFNKAGQFDENFGINWGCEDYELGYRLHQNKSSFVYSFSAANYHISHYRFNYIKNLKQSIDFFYSIHRSKLIKNLFILLDGEIKNPHRYLKYLDKYTNREL